MTSNQPDMTTCDKCAKECEFKTLIHNPNDEWLCEKCDEAVANRQPKEEYDDMGVLCRYTEEDGWYPIEDYCVTCGYRCDECECEEGEEEWVYPCEECDGRPCECKSK